MHVTKHTCKLTKFSLSAGGCKLIACYPATVDRARFSATSCEDWDLVFEWLGEEKMLRRSEQRSVRKKMPCPFSISVIWYLSLSHLPKSKNNDYKQEKAPAPCTSIPTSQKSLPARSVVKLCVEAKQGDAKTFVISIIIASSPLQYVFRGLCFRTANCSCSLASARRAVTGAAS